jgi:hypothetical protein
VPRGTVQTNLGGFGRPFVDSLGFSFGGPGGHFGENPPRARAPEPGFRRCWEALTSFQAGC